MVRFEAGIWQRMAPVILSPTENPAAGSIWYVDLPTTPEGVYYRPKSILYRYTASAAAGSRNIGIYYANGDGAPYARIFTAINVGAGIVSDQTWLEMPTNGQVTRGGGAVIAQHLFALPYDFRLPGGHRIRANVAFLTPDTMDPTDQFASVMVLCDRYIYQPASQDVPAAGEGLDRVDVERLRVSIDKLACAIEAARGVSPVEVTA